MNLDIPAIALAQNAKRTIFAFPIDGKSIYEFAAISRAGRDADKNFTGYQRPEVKKHIQEIKKYIESDGPMIPNAVVLALEPETEFFPIDPDSKNQAQHGVLRIRRRQKNEAPSAWIVDGQQRLAAIRESTVSSFPLFAIGFIANTEEEQREQFLLVNSAKPLSRALIHELLPSVRSHLPTQFAKRQLPSALLNELNTNQASPLFGQIATATNPEGRLKDNSLLQFLENSLSDGVLYRISQEVPEHQQPELMTDVLIAFWNAVQATWADIWHLKPRKSRLLHGAGVVSLGFLMDAMADRVRPEWPNSAFFIGELQKIKPHCRWNEGFWEFSATHHRRWDEIQNTPKDVQLVSNHLGRTYLRTWARG